MVKTSRVDSKGDDLDSLITTLLLVAGSWFILSKALEAAGRARSQEKGLQGDEWARTILEEIEKVRKASLSKSPQGK